MGINVEETWGGPDHSPDSGAAPVVHWATVNRAPAAVDGELFVTIKNATGGFHETGPCRWMPKSSATGSTYIPAVGDICAVVFDDENNPWVVSWTGGVELAGSEGGGSASFPVGGTTGQYLGKASNVDNDVSWQSIPSIPTAATALPIVDGTAAAGTSPKWAHEDHVHPTDTSRAAAADLTTEAATRASADTTLQNNINSEATTRASAISSEATTRANADTTLQANIDAHISDTTAAHAASAISYLGSTNLSSTDVEGALDELDAEKVSTTDPRLSDYRTPVGSALTAGQVFYGSGGNVVVAGAPDSAGLLDKATAQTITSLKTIQLAAVGTMLQALVSGDTQAYRAALISYAPTATDFGIKLVFSHPTNASNTAELKMRNTGQFQMNALYLAADLDANSFNIRTSGAIAGSLALSTTSGVYSTTGLAAGTSTAFKGKISADTQYRVELALDQLRFGPGGTTAPDAGFKRSAADTLQMLSGDTFDFTTGGITVPTVAASTTVTSQAAVGWDVLQRELGNPSTSRPSVSVYKSANQTLANATDVLVSFDSELFDTDSMHDTATNNSRLVATATATYTVVARGSFVTNTAGTRYVSIRKNSGGSSSGGTRVATATAHPSQTAGYGTDVIAVGVVQLAIGDYVEMFAHQSSGGNLDLSSSSGQTTFAMAWTGNTGAAWGNAGAQAYNNATQFTSATPDTWAPLALNSESFDIDGEHDTVTNNTRVTCVTPGKYLYVASISIQGGTGADEGRGVSIRKNGTLFAGGTYIQRPTTTLSPSTNIQAVAILDMAVGDYVEVCAVSHIASQVVNAANTTTNLTNCVLSGVRVGYQTNPSKNGQFIASKVFTANANSDGPSSVSGFATYNSSPGELTLTGDGVNYIKIQANGFGTYLVSGTAGYYDLGIYDDSAGAFVAKTQCYSPSAGNEEQGGFHIVAFIPPFTGTKSFQLAVSKTAGNVIQNQAAATYPTRLWAEWMGPTL